MGAARNLQIGDLPPPDCPRWTPGRKAAVVTEIAFGRMSPDEAAERWALDRTEITYWSDRYRRFGMKGLSVTKIQAVDRRPTYRGLPASQGRAGR